MDGVQDARQWLGQGASVFYANGHEAGAPLLQLGAFLRGLDLKAEHFAIHGLNGEQGDDGVSGLYASFDLSGPVDTHREVTIEENRVALLNQLAFDQCYQRLVRFGVALIDQNHFRRARVHTF